MSNSLRERPLAIVTGGNLGPEGMPSIGNALVQELTSAGYGVLATVRSQEKADALNEDMERMGLAGIASVLMLSRSEDIRPWYEEMTRLYGPTKVLVNNAADPTPSLLEELSDQKIIEGVAVNLTAPLLLTKHAAAHLSQTDGSVLHISSLGAYMPAPGMSELYVGPKAALAAIARIGDKGYRLNTLVLGAVETIMLKNMPEDMRGVLKENDQILSPAQVALAIRRIVESSCTNKIIHYNGGLYAPPQGNPTEVTYEDLGL